MERNYVRADDIRDELNNVHGIYVWDKDNLWSASPIAPKRRYKNYAFGTSGSNSGGDDLSSSKGRQFGRYGHDYTQIGDEIDEAICPLALHEIHSLIAKQLGHKLVREYKKADEIQTVLFANWVRIHDRNRQWRADGGTFDDVHGMLVGAAGKVFEINSYSEPIIEDGEGDNDGGSSLLLEEIVELVNKRDEARKRRDYDQADQIRQVLWNDYRVAVDDKS